MDFLWKRRKKKWKLNQWNIAWLSLYKITVEIWDNWHLAQLTPWINIYFCLKLIIYRKYRVIQFQFRHWKTVFMSVLVITNEVTSRPSHTCSYSHNEFVMVMSSNEFECRSSSTWTTFSFIKSMSSEKNETIFQINCYRRLKFYIVFETNQNFRVWKAVNPIFFYLVGTWYGFQRQFFRFVFNFKISISALCVWCWFFQQENCVNCFINETNFIFGLWIIDRIDSIYIVISMDMQLKHLC